MFKNYAFFFALGLVTSGFNVFASCNDNYHKVTVVNASVYYYTPTLKVTDNQDTKSKSVKSYSSDKSCWPDNSTLIIMDKTSNNSVGCLLYNKEMTISCVPVTGTFPVCGDVCYPYGTG